MTQLFLSRQELAARWGVSIRTIDRLREAGKLPWIDISAGRGGRPIVRFLIQDVEEVEQNWRQNMSEEEA